MITNADVPLIRGLLCYLLPGRSTYYEDFSIYIMGLSHQWTISSSLTACHAWSDIYLQLFNF